VTTLVEGRGVLRSAAVITFCTTASRITGFVRVLAVGAALGATFLGNTYQSSNLVSNILVDLLAGGLTALAAMVMTLWLLHAPELRAGTRRALFGGLAAADEPVY
jgi:putative peptidoglycan lipid II flippase